MSNPNPCVRTRFKPGQSGNPAGGRTRAIVNRILNEKYAGSPRTVEEAIWYHMADVATRWEVRTIGYDHELEEPIRVASGRDSVEAAKVLFSYTMGKVTDKDPLKIAEHFRQVERDRMDVALKLLGDRINSWQPEKVRDFLLQCARDPRGFMQAAEEYLGLKEDEAQALPGEKADHPQALPEPDKEPSE